MVRIWWREARGGWGGAETTVIFGLCCSEKPGDCFYYWAKWKHRGWLPMWRAGSGSDWEETWKNGDKGGRRRVGEEWGVIMLESTNTIAQTSVCVCVTDTRLWHWGRVGGWGGLLLSPHVSNRAPQGRIWIIMRTSENRTNTTLTSPPQLSGSYFFLKSWEHFDSLTVDFNPGDRLRGTNTCDQHGARERAGKHACTHTYTVHIHGVAKSWYIYMGLLQCQLLKYYLC